MAVEAISWGTRAVSSRLFTSVTYVYCLNYNLMINISKKKKKAGMEEMEEYKIDLGWMKDFKE